MTENKIRKQDTFQTGDGNIRQESHRKVRNVLLGLRCYSMTFLAFELVEDPFILLRALRGSHKGVGSHAVVDNEWLLRGLKIARYTLGLDMEFQFSTTLKF